MTPICDRVGVARRYVRSIDVERDLADPGALDGYVVTPTVQDALHRLLRGLAEGSTHRAFRLTGPYGAGKSAFLLLLARLMRERSEPGSPAAALLRARCPDRLADLQACRHYEPLIVSGRRTGFADLLLAALERRFSEARGPGRRPAVAERLLGLLAERAGGRVDDAAVLDLAREYASHLSRARGGRGGLLILVDEMGLCLEHAASRREGVDSSVFQRLGEMAAGASDAPIAVVGVLHQRFAEYASSLGERVQDEWTRSAERYEDLPFQEGVEQIGFLIAEALSVAAPGHDPAVARAGEALFAEAVRRGLIRAHGAEFASVGSRLYPLHPSTVLAIATAARRFGQNERSAFGFLQGHEPHGFQDFVRRTPYGPSAWYRLPELVDHMVSRGDGGPREGVAGRRWRLLVDALTAHPDLPAMEADVLKCVGLISVLDPIPGLRPDAATVGFCLGDEELGEAVGAALDALVRRRLVYRRPHRDDFSLWASSSVDLDGWVARARELVPAPTRLSTALATLPSARPVVAHKHYHETGTLRAFGVLFDSEGVGLDAPEPGAGLDGWIIVVPVHPDEDGDGVLAGVRARPVRPNVLHCVRWVPPSLLAAAHDLQTWRWIEANCGELALDDLARREVSERIQAARDHLADALAPFERPTVGEEADVAWVQGGQVVELVDRAQLHRLLSEVCDEVYAAAPIVHNELANRSRLSSAAAAARMRLMERMASNYHEAGLGLAGTPPEKAIYLSVLLASGIHRPLVDGVWGFAAPAPDHPKRWRPAWDRISSLLGNGDVVAIGDVVRELERPPCGLRPGVSLVLVTAFLLARRRDVSLLERNTFVPDVSSALLMRLARNLRKFSLRLVVEAPQAVEVLEGLSTVIGLWAQGPNRPPPEAAPITEALMMWHVSLPAFARETRTVSPLAQAVRQALDKATDPVELIFERLPRACGLPLGERPGVVADPAQFVGLLDECLEEIRSAPARMRDAALGVLLDTFGVRDAARLRAQVGTDYAPFEAHLVDARMKAFVNRSADGALSHGQWLDSIASLLTGRRLDGWHDKTLDVFGFEVQGLASRLARWLAAARAKVAARAPVLSIHVVDPEGRESAMIAHPSVEGEPDAVADQIRGLLHGRRDAAFLLARLLGERIQAVEEVREGSHADR